MLSLLGLRIERNGVEVVQGVSENNDRQVNTQVTLQLVAGDTVAVVFDTGAGSIQGGTGSVFSGFRLY
nr:hypothetical protein BaRGS_006284 [Batillaria attramentaria]